MQTLMSLSGDQLTDQLAQQDVTAAATAPAVSIGRDNATGETVWTIEQDQLDQHLDGDNKTQSASEAASDDQQVQPESPASAEQPVSEEVQAEQSEQPELPKAPEYLPDASPEEQYRFALARPCRMIWKQQKMRSLNLASCIQNMNGLLTPCSGRAGYSSFRASLKKQQRPFQSSMPFIQRIHGYQTPPCGSLNLSQNSRMPNRPVQFMKI